MHTPCSPVAHCLRLSVPATVMSPSTVPGQFHSSIPRKVVGLGSDVVLSIACGQYHTALSMERSGVWCFGKNDYGQLGINSPDSKILPCRVSEPLLGVCRGGGCDDDKRWRRWWRFCQA